MSLPNNNASCEIIERVRMTKILKMYSVTVSCNRNRMSEVNCASKETHKQIPQERDEVCGHQRLRGRGTAELPEQPTCILAREIPGQRRLAGCSPSGQSSPTQWSQKAQTSSNKINKYQGI